MAALGSGTNDVAQYSPSFGYAPADFDDAELTRPLEAVMDPTGQGILTPYSTLVSNVLNRHMYEIREKSGNPAFTVGSWRRRMKEFMNQKNDDLTLFLRKPLMNHPTLGNVEPFMRRFGRSEFSSAQNSLSNVLLDGSGTLIFVKLEEELLKVGPASPQQIVEEVKWLYDAYRQAGEEALKAETRLKTKMDAFDKIYQKLVGFMGLPPSEDIAELSNMIEKYISKTFQEQAIEEDYKAFIESYRRFAALREMIQTFRFSDQIDKEPLCSICMTETVAFVLSPCGHTFCGTCAKRQMTSCYMCRATIRERIKIFFG
jgi:hypothetical protein